MIIRLSLLLVILLVGLSACESPAEEPSAAVVTTPTETEAPTAAPEKVATVNDFVPASYSILRQIEGDLDQNGTTDVALVLKSDQEGTPASQQSCGDVLRPLILLKRNETGQLSMSLRNDHTILGEGCGGTLGDPFQNLTIENGTLTVLSMGGSREQWANTQTFRYQPEKNNWELVKNQTEVMDRMQPDQTQIIDNMSDKPQSWLSEYNTYQ